MLNSLCLELTPKSVWAMSPNSNSSSSGTSCFLCRGKFEERAAAPEPFDALRASLRATLDQFLLEDQQQQQKSESCGHNTKENHSTRLRKALGPDLRILTSVLPQLNAIVDDKRIPRPVTALNDGVLFDSFGGTAHIDWQFE